MNRVDLNKLKVKLDPKYLFEKLELSPEQYPISINTKGEYRIKCGSRNYSIIDFMLKEMNYNFKDAISLLEDTYQEQQQIKKDNIQHNTPHVVKSQTSKNQERRKMINEFINEQKKEDLTIFASANGYEIDRAKSSRSYRVMKHKESGDRIIISKKGERYLYYNPNNQNDKGTVYDFFKNRNVTKHEDIYKALKNTDKESIKSNIPVLVKATGNYNSDLLYKEYSEFTPYSQSSNTYLERRGLNADLLKNYSCIKVDHRNNVVTPMYAHNKEFNIQFAFSGYNQKLNKPIEYAKEGGKLDKPIKDLNRGNKSITVLKADNTVKNIETIIVSESSIDGLSYLQLKNLNPSSTLIVSSNGNTSEKSLSHIKDLSNMYPAANVILAYDNDKAGKEFARQTKTLINKAIEDYPTSKDWNEELQTSKSEPADKIKRRAIRAK